MEELEIIGMANDEVANFEDDLRELINGWREYADGHYCQIYNRGMAQGLNLAADSLENLLDKFKGME